MNHPSLHYAVLVVLLLGPLAGCHTVLPSKLGGNPADLPRGASAWRVRQHMGEPTSVTRSPSYPQHQIWHYGDYWWDKPGWANRWGSWTLVMRKTTDGVLRLQSWQIADPPGQEGIRAFPSRTAAAQGTAEPSRIEPLWEPAGGRVLSGSARSVQHTPLE